MEGAIVIIIIILLLLVLTPIIMASNTRGRIDGLSRQIDFMENKIDELMNLVKSQQQQGANIQEKTVVEKPPKEVIQPIITEEQKIQPKVTAPIIIPEPEKVEPPLVKAPEIVAPTLNIIPESEESAPQPLKQEPIAAINEVQELHLEEEVVETAYEPESSWWDKFNAKNPDLEKFIGENLISKIGIGVLVLGIAFFVKYAIDKNWINEYARVGIGMLAGGIVLGFAHTLRAKFKPFSSVLVSGAIAIFYFTITIGFQEYQIFSQAAAFAIMCLITAFSVFISMAYNRQELAVLSLIGGFAAPFMVSTGEGNYKVLFTYLLILDVGMLVISILRSWKLVYYLSCAFTILIFGGWYFNRVNETNNLYGGAVFFASLFYLTFIFMGVFINVYEKRKFQPSDITILLLINSLYCGLGLNAFSFFHPELKGAFIAGLACFNFATAWMLQRRFEADRTLIYFLIGITLTYATLAAPVQLHGNYITLFWAAETTLLMWLGQKSEFKIFRFVSVMVFLLMCVSMVMDWQQIYGPVIDVDPLRIMANKGFLTSMFCLSAISLQVFLLRKEDKEMRFADFTLNIKLYRSVLMVIAFILAYLGGILELNYQLKTHQTPQELMRILIWSYHFVFCTGIIYLALVYLNIKKPYLALSITVANTMMLLLAFSSLPFDLLRNHFVNGESFQTGFLFHYVVLLSYLMQVFLMVRFLLQQKEIFHEYLRYTYWVLSITSLGILSAELVLHLSLFAFSPQLTNANGESIDILTAYQDFHTQIYKIGFPILWGCIAFVLLALGIRKQIRDLRIIALALLALTLIKLAVYDIKEVSEAGKIIAFILLGVLLLVMSFMYQKIKAIILDDKK